jgi:hypothetical protein
MPAGFASPQHGHRGKGITDQESTARSPGPRVAATGFQDQDGNELPKGGPQAAAASRARSAARAPGRPASGISG